MDAEAPGKNLTSLPVLQNLSSLPLKHLAPRWEDDVYVAPAKEIGLVYACLFLPLGLAWAVVLRFSTLERHANFLLPLTLVVMIIGFDVANQSLSVFVPAPMAITSMHALSLGLVMSLWTFAADVRALRAMSLMPLWYWGAVMALFALYQMCNHLVSYHCSLSERIIFSNLCPVLSLVIEIIVMPRNKQPRVSWSSKLALVCMALGAILFSSQKADFTKKGFFAASTLVVVSVPYRVAQRWVVTSHCQDFPPALLAALDGYALFLPSILVSENSMHRLGQTPVTQWAGWLENNSIILLTLLTAVTFVCAHVCGILLMRAGTATSYIVFVNLANFVLVALSCVFFHDNVVETGVMFAGLMISLLSGTWYASQARAGQRRMQTLQAKGKAVDQVEDMKSFRVPGGREEALIAEALSPTLKGV